MNKKYYKYVVSNEVVAVMEHIGYAESSFYKPIYKEKLNTDKEIEIVKCIYNKLLFDSRYGHYNNWENGSTYKLITDSEIKVVEIGEKEAILYVIKGEE